MLGMTEYAAAYNKACKMTEQYASNLWLLIENIAKGMDLKAHTSEESKGYIRKT